ASGDGSLPPPGGRGAPSRWSRFRAIRSFRGCVQGWPGGFFSPPAKGVVAPRNGVVDVRREVARVPSRFHSEAFFPRFFCSGEFADVIVRAVRAHRSELPGRLSRRGGLKNFSRGC